MLCENESAVGNYWPELMLALFPFMDIDFHFYGFGEADNMLEHASYFGDGWNW